MHIKIKAGHLAGHSQLLETNIPGIFAAGDVRDKSTKKLVSDGGSATLMIRGHLKKM
jgi:thioredoxin reductase (NADPH)